MSPIDRISKLPEELITAILSTLPTKDVIATSILSRNWRFRWKNITSFHFDSNNIVDHALLNHNGGSISHFILCWKSPIESQRDQLELPTHRSECLKRWANTAIGKKVRVLDLHAGPFSISSEYDFDLPDDLYLSETLEVLKLKGPFRIKPPNVICLPKVGEMVLDDVIYESDESFRNFIHGCPILESLKVGRSIARDNLVVCNISSLSLKNLVIDFNHVDDNEEVDEDVDFKLHIDAPGLESLYICDYRSIHVVIQPQLPVVTKVTLNVISYDQNMMVSLLQAVSNVKLLTLLANTITDENAELPLNLSFKRLSKLVIHVEYLPRWSCLTDLLHGCIELTELEICYFVENHCGDPWRNPACVPRCLSLSLKRLTCRVFKGEEEGIAMLKFFLDHGLVMETVIL